MAVWRVRVVRDDFPDIINNLKGGEAAAVVQAVAEQIASNAAGRAPVRTGSLASSIRAVAVSALHWQVIASGADDFDGHPYAMYVEFGTAKHGGPQPFMTPAAADEFPSFESQMLALIEG